ncbi:protein of unknown function [Porphyromonadaceae bacterium KHP3R9]|nr:protein of unknown function [Porphyromonadaceae bacterium KHP3R9]
MSQIRYRVVFSVTGGEFPYCIHLTFKIMNRRLLITLLCGLFTFALYSQSSISLEQLYRKFANARNVEKVSLGGLKALLFKPLSAKYGNGFSISGIHVLELDGCSNEVKQQFNSMAEKLRDDKYEVLLKANEQDEKTRILARIEKEEIRELVILSLGDEPVLVRIKGKFKPEHIQQLVNVDNNGQ